MVPDGDVGGEGGRDVGEGEGRDVGVGGGRGVGGGGGRDAGGERGRDVEGGEGDAGGEGGRDVEGGEGKEGGEGSRHGGPQNLPGYATVRMLSLSKRHLTLYSGSQVQNMHSRIDVQRFWQLIMSAM